ncbi:LLM class F420-dependent oxidoreductase [Catellatospora bangladeshensis]|uniref:LLM class F420-dependent oxidoreductase n=1 Tax=Catellatospora bangladeshensis TaxID=310355 RepID=A0A8J3NK34_9ACTN|nr:LLM class F420-dependent oxidoreductase [Catellatospora bangladeshensis]GIF81065.1 LLM class F420-dependent oxidoreductase [Catellatospora bangladeshensis]
MSAFRLSSNVFAVPSANAFTDRCRLAERLGYDTVFAADHLGAPAPFPVLVAAAAATERLRVGTLVLNVPFWNPALLAREIATADLLTGGRLEVGLGAGHMKWEFDAAGIPFERFGARTARLAETITELGRWFRAEDTRPLPGGAPPLPVQKKGFGGYGPPLIVGGTGDRVLRIAAEHADIVSIAGAYQVKNADPGTFRLGTAAETDERVAFTRALAGPRAAGIEWHTLIQLVVETDDRAAKAEELSARVGMPAAEVLECPFLLFGTADEMAAQLSRQRERWGFSYLTVHDPYLEAFAPVIAALRG